MPNHVSNEWTVVDGPVEALGSLAGEAGAVEEGYVVLGIKVLS